MTRARVVVVGLGPAGPELVTRQAVEEIAHVPAAFVRTTRHPAAAVVAGATSFDAVYDRSPSLDVVYATIVDELVAAAVERGEVLYAVPGSPLVAERTVELLRADDRVEVVVVPALSFLDLVWARLGVDPLAAGVRLVDGQRFGVEAAGERGPLVVGQCDTREVLSDIKLSVDDGEPPSIVVLHHLGLPDEQVFEVEWAELDRSFTPDHLTALWIPELHAPVATELQRFAELVRTLRRECPWDREQTHRTLTRHLVEETYETLEAIDALDGSPESIGHLEEELGDLLFQVFFHATLATEEGWFTLADVARVIHDKLVHRHPHVFGTVEADSAEQVLVNWEQIKKAEKGRDSVMDGLPENLPSLLYAHKVQRKAASVGFDWDDVEGALPKVVEELHELEAAMASGVEPDIEGELGDLLFAVVNVARHLDIDPETALRGASAKFRTRFRAVEAAAAGQGRDLSTMSLAELDALWDQAKR
ncbi:MAG TPA: nucleoside triphosphate pyrophosphohydrolase [Acidimicrobiales bacterium]|nr:nucleoside triphosphate pyrophosphohydrolase [Acidimicrobiales bacterium]